MARRERVAAFVLALPGVVPAFRLLFEGYSPFCRWDLLWTCIIVLLPAPAFLALPIAAWQVRRLMGSRVSSLEVALAYALSAAAMLAPLLTILLMLAEPGVVTNFWRRIFWWVVMLGPLCGLGGANVLLLVRNLRKRVPREVAAESFLLSSYFPFTILDLIFFWPPIQPLSISVLILVASVAYLLTIVFLLRGRRIDRP